MADFDQEQSDHATIQETDISVDHGADNAFKHGAANVTDQGFNPEHRDFDLVAVPGFDQVSNQGLDHAAGQGFDHEDVQCFDHVENQGYYYPADHSFDNAENRDFDSPEGQSLDNPEAKSSNHAINLGLPMDHDVENVEHNKDFTLDNTIDDSSNQTLDNIEGQEKQGHDDQKRWPGWPGESVFRMLVPAQRVGSIIGRKGEFIKKLVEETRARIKILDGPPGTTERAVIISAKEEPDHSIPPAVDGLLKIHKRLVEGLENDSSAKVSLKLLVPQSQAGILIGKQGGTVKSIQETAGCMVRVIPTDLPIFALKDDRVVELVGEPNNVQKALEIIASHLRKFLVDRSVIPLFETTMQTPNPQMEHMPPPHQSWGAPLGLPPNAVGGPGFGQNLQNMPPPRYLGSYYPPGELPPPLEKQPHQGISAYGREVPIHASSNAQAAPSMITQMTQQMQIPLSYADALIGTAGANISYIRRASGATITIQETRGVPNEMTVEISGNSSEVQTAQQLIQNFMAEATGPGQVQTSSSVDQSYNPYAAHYSSPASNPSHAGHTGYSSAYGTNYGY